MGIVPHRSPRLLSQALAPLALTLLAPSALARRSPSGAEAADTHGTLQLISEHQSLEPGHDSWIGLRFNLEKGWHIYWLNPGDSGEPPKVNWELPAGFSAGDMQWPAPRRLEHPPLTDFGYEGEVLLLARIHPPAQFAGGSGTAGLAADVKWLVCRDVCIPARERVSLSLAIQPGAPKADPEWSPLFARTRARLPKSAPAAWKTAARQEGKDFVLSVESGAPEASAVFFPLQPLQIEDAAPQRATSLPRGFQLTLEKSDQLLHPLENLKGVIVLGNDRAYRVDVPVSQNNKRRTL